MRRRCRFLQFFPTSFTPSPLRLPSSLPPSAPPIVGSVRRAQEP